MTDEQLATLESLGLAAIAELRRLREENARLRARLEAQIGVSTKAQRRVLELEAQIAKPRVGYHDVDAFYKDEEAPEYVTKEAR